MSNDLYAALLRERYGAPITRTETRRAASPYPQHGDGGPDTDFTTRQRQRDLCAALDQPRKRAAA
jgi:hypothetical protein